MRRVVFALVIAVVLAVPGLVAAQNSADIVEQIDIRGYAVEAGVDLDVNRLDSTARDLNADGVALVVLASEFSNGNDLLAVDVVELAEREWTVLVLSSASGGALDVGYASANLSFDRLDAAADDAFAQPSRDPLDFALAFAAGLGAAGSASGGSGSSGGGSGFLVFLVIVVVIGVGFFLWSRRRSQADAATKVEAAKGELTDDLAAVANDILALGERGDVKNNDEAFEHYSTANEIYLEVNDGLPKADTLDAVDDLDDALELAGWHLDVAEAIVDGDPIPDKPTTEEVWEMGSGPAADSLPSARGRSDRRAPTAAGRAELPAQFPRPAPRRRRGGGGMGGVLGGVLGGILSSGGLSGGGNRGGGRRNRSGGGLRPAPRSRPSGGSRRRPSTRRRSAAGRGRRRG